MKRSISAAILGAADGTCSISGVIAGGAAAHASDPKIAVIALGGAAAATVSMAGGEFLSEDHADALAIFAMGAGTLLGSALPALPLLLLSGFGVWPAVIAVSLLIGLAVAYVRAKSTGRPSKKAATQTFAVLIVAGLVGYLAGLA